MESRFRGRHASHDNKFRIDFIQGNAIWEARYESHVCRKLCDGWGYRLVLESTITEQVTDIGSKILTM
jgi:hypothetical protein